MSLPSSSAIDSLSAGIHSMGLGGPSMHSGMSMPSPMPQGPVRRGVVKFFNCAKGFGFIVDQTPEQLGGQEVFCHFSAISGKGGFRSLAEGEEVEYELVQGPKGFQAANLSGPNGRAVVGDPKARLAKPPPYMPFAPMSMPPYLSDPYSQQHPGVYASSPYTQHVLYPSNNPLSSQYTYTSPSGPGGPANASTASEFRAFGGSYQQQQQLQQQQAAYAGLSSNYPSAASAQFGAPSALGGGSFAALGGQGQYGSASLGAIGGVQQIGGDRNGVVGVRGASAFAPFNSPPAFNNAPLFAAPTGFGYPTNGGASASNGSASYLSSQQLQQQQVPRQSNSDSPLLSSDPYANGNVSGSFGSGAKAVNGMVGGPRTGTPREERRDERRGTPVGLGNGTASGSVFAPVLFTTGDREARDYA